MDNDRELEDLLDLTDTSDSSLSSSGGMFEGHTPFVLELHDIRKDDPPPVETSATAAAAKNRKLKKKKKEPATEHSNSSVSSNSLSEPSSVAPSIADTREEFYDAHESYHAIPESQSLIAAATRIQAHSETSHNPKAPRNQSPSLHTNNTTATTTTTTSSSRREPSTISKPTVPHE